MKPDKNTTPPCICGNRGYSAAVNNEHFEGCPCYVHSTSDVEAGLEQYKQHPPSEVNDEPLYCFTKDQIIHYTDQARKEAVREESERICTDLDEMWSALYGAYLNNQDLRELIKNVVNTPTPDLVDK